jgi:hypothetical protein
LTAAFERASEREEERLCPSFSKTI